MNSVSAVLQETEIPMNTKSPAGKAKGKKGKGAGRPKGIQCFYFFLYFLRGYETGKSETTE